MKCKLLSIILVSLLVSTEGKGQILNGHFSDWALDSIGRMDLVGWTTSNLMYSAPGCLQDTDRTSGSGYSLKLISFYDSTMQDYIVTVLDLEHAPYSNPTRPTIFSGFWKMNNPFFTDGMAMEVNLYNSSNVEIGNAGVGTPFTGSIPNWIAFNDSITYTSNDPVTSYSIQIVFFNLSNQVGPYGLLDDLTFDVSVGLENKPEKFSTFVHTLSNSEYIINISQKYAKNVIAKVFDLLGNYLFTVKGDNSSRQSININLSNFSSGMYLCRVENGSSNEVIKLINQK